MRIRNMRTVPFFAALFLTACVPASMSGTEFVQANRTCEQANQHFEAQVECLNDFLLTRNAESFNHDVYYTWVKERKAIMDLYRTGELNRANTKLALLDAQHKYEGVLHGREMRSIARHNALERSRPRHCRSRKVGGGDIVTDCY